MTPLKKFEIWILQNNLKSQKLITPIDKIASYLGYSGKPLVFMSYLILSLILSLYWFIFFPLLSYIIVELLLGIPIKNLIFEEIGYSLLVSVCFGFFVGFFIKRSMKKYNVPTYETFLKDL